MKWNNKIMLMLIYGLENMSSVYTDMNSIISTKELSEFP